ncbi:response regulator [Sphingomonas sp. R1]|uniref:response regulator n=1 Tax=Sphingomonas sp. R1 TaxID=399176 RepID=UPI00222517AB|nr:response regulator [Sphingomonas sp. R1]UYY76885.1 response regulator [Sphingomonas sp. R1]
MALALVGLLVRLALGPTFLGFPFITFTPAVLAAGYVAGARAGLACAAASAALAWFFLVVPFEKSGVTSPHGLIAIGVFLTNAVLIVLVVSGMNRAYARAVFIEEERARSNVQLEQRVAERTHQLSEANQARLAEADARREAEARAAQADRLDAIGRLTGGVAHDFNNMLAVIIGNLELAEAKLNRGDVDVIRHIDGAMDGARRSATLTRRLLAFARLQPLDPVVTQINELIKGIEELLIRTLGERVSIECELDPDLWHVNVDPGQLEGALVNLAVNARDAMPDGGSLHIRTRNVSGSHVTDGPPDLVGHDHIVIEVTDTGTGMSEEVQARAFEPFFTTKEPGRGTGLGLSQLYGFMRQSGGGVKIRSSLGSGTTIALYLPRCEAPLAAVQRMVTARTTAPRAVGGETILVVEDEDRVRKATSETLQELGYRVLEASDGTQALELLSGSVTVDLVLSDIVMPGMSGSELADVVRRQRPEMRFLFMSGYSADQFGERSHGGDDRIDLLTKPFTRDRLARHVRKLLDSST